MTDAILPSRGALRLVLAVVIITTMGLAAGADPAEAQQQSAEPIGGMVVQGTADAAIPPGLEVTLTVIGQDETPVEQFSAPVAEDGSFEFAVPSPDSDFELVITHAGVTQAKRFSSLDDLASIELLIHETTESLDTISVPSYGSVLDVVEGREGELVVMDRIQITNVGDQTVVPMFNDEESDAIAGFVFGLAKDYRDLTVESDLVGITFEQTRESIAIQGPFPPGTYQVFIRYVVPYQGGELSVNRSLPLGAEQVKVFIRASAGNITAPGLVPEEPTLIGESDYRVLVGQDFAPGSEIEITVSQLPSEPWITRAVSTTTGKATLVLIIAVVGAGIVVGGRSWWHRRPGEMSAEELAQERVELISLVADIDDRHEAGNLSEREHNRLRQSLIRRIKRLPETTPADATKALRE